MDSVGRVKDYSKYFQRSENLVRQLLLLSQCFLASGICAFSRCQTLCTLCIQFAVRFLAKVFDMEWGTGIPIPIVRDSSRVRLKYLDSWHSRWWLVFICPHWCNSMSHWSGFSGWGGAFIYSVLVQYLYRICMFRRYWLELSCTTSRHLFILLDSITDFHCDQVFTFLYEIIINK